MNSKLTSIIKVIIFFYLIISFLFIVLDLLNIRILIPISDNYDWLSYIGTTLSGITVLVVSMITIHQNEELANMNQEALENSIKADTKFRICFRKQQEIENDIYLMKIYELSKISLRDVTIESIELQKYNGKDYIDSVKINKFHNKRYELEYTDNMDKDDFYYAKVDVNHINNELNGDDGFYRMYINMKVSNIFNVEIKYKYYIIMKLLTSNENKIVFDRVHTFEYIDEIKYIKSK